MNGGSERGALSMLELFHFEDCPYCQKVRRKLEELDVSYLSHPSPRGSIKREFLGRFVPDLQFPLLVDVEKNIFMFESQDIIDYLEKNYRKIKR
jgi:glutathione S-transferase